MRGWRLGVALGVAAAAGFVAGGFTGAARLQQVIRPIQIDTAMAQVNFRVDELAYLRTGETEKALRLMEHELDAALLLLDQLQEGEAPSPDTLSSLAIAKRYRATFPAEGRAAEATTLLASVPDGPLDPASTRRPAVRVLREAGQDL